MIIQSIEFIGSAAHASQFPTDGLPQFILAGRSNVGKSSFINAMLNNHKVARVSQTPGKTRLLNFFLINHAFYLVDVPGYGFANVSQTIQDTFQELLESYFTGNNPTLMAIQLLDIRHKPTEDDLLMYRYFKHFRLPVMVIATKVDKVSNNVRFNQLQVLKRTIGLSDLDPLIPFSSVTKDTTDQVWSVLEKTMEKPVESNF
jgi:GTP-binding protein